uniref:3-isopropylmalate dehydrogenase n=1 Tax=Stylophora pistillata TaxID=50429 RepID=A0A2B4R1Y7_STYPI
MELNIALLAGDGIGPEIITEAVKVSETVAKKFGHKINWKKGLVGAAAIDAVGEPYPDATHQICKEADAVLFGAIGDPKFDNDPSAKVRPEQGLLKMRKSLGLFANVRPTFTFDSLLDKSPLKRERIEGTDLVFLRELTGGIYFGEKGYIDSETAYDHCVYTKKEIKRLAKKGFELAMSRNKKLCCVDKANVLETSRLWRATVQEMESDYPEVKVSYEFVDAVAMRLIQYPGDYDVLITENLFGDILTDEASVITGSMGLMPSASVGESVALFEPIHGSFPQATGKNIANPLATILSAAMLFDMGLGLKKEATVIRAVFLQGNVGGIIDAGAGNNSYRMDKDTAKFYLYNFNNGDKIYFSSTYDSNDDGTKDADDFKGYVLSSYANRNSVVAHATAGQDRIIYITGTGELYRDENGDAVFKADGTVDLKTGSNDKRIGAIDKEEGSNAGTMIRFVNAVAADFKDKIISTLAYQYTRKPTKKTSPAPNVMITLCSIECDRSDDIENKCEKFTADLKGWCQLTKNIRIWDYTTQFTNFLAPFPNLHTLRPNIRLFKQNNAKWVFEQHSRNPSELFELRSYLMAKLLWNSERNEWDIISEFTEAYYGKAAKHILDYIKDIHQKITKNYPDFFLFLYGDPSQAFDAYLNPDNLRLYMRFFDRAAKAVEGDETLSNRVAKARLGIDFAFLEACKKNLSADFSMTQKKEGKQIINPILKQRLFNFKEVCEQNNIFLMNEMGLTVAHYYQQYEKTLARCMMPNKARGKKVTLLTKPHKYADENPQALTDGALGGNNFYANWLGFEGNHLEAIIDLGSQQTISSIDMAFLKVTNHVVFYPLEVVYAIAGVDQKFKVVGTVLNDDPLTKKTAINDIQYFHTTFKARKASTFVSCIGDEFLIETDDPETPADPVEEPISKIEAQDFIRKNKTDFFKADVEYVVFHQIEGVVFTSTNVDIIYHNHDANIHLYKNKEGEIQSFISSVYEVDYPGVDKTKGFSGIKFLWTTDGKIFAKQYYAYGKRGSDNYKNYYQQRDGKPCKGDPVPNPRIAAQKVSGIRGGMFGYTRTRKDGKPDFHDGIDLLNNYGDPVYAISVFYAQTKDEKRATINDVYGKDFPIFINGISLDDIEATRGNKTKIGALFGKDMDVVKYYDDASDNVTNVSDKSKSFYIRFEELCYDEKTEKRAYCVVGYQILKRNSNITIKGVTLTIGDSIEPLAAKAKIFHTGDEITFSFPSSALDVKFDPATRKITEIRYWTPT